MFAEERKQVLMTHKKREGGAMLSVFISILERDWKNIDPINDPRYLIHCHQMLSMVELLAQAFNDQQARKKIASLRKVARQWAGSAAKSICELPKKKTVEELKKVTKTIEEAFVELVCRTTINAVQSIHLMQSRGNRFSLHMNCPAYAHSVKILAEVVLECLKTIDKASLDWHRAIRSLYATAMTAYSGAVHFAGTPEEDMRDVEEIKKILQQVCGEIKIELPTQWTLYLNGDELALCFDENALVEFLGKTQMV